MTNEPRHLLAAADLDRPGYDLLFSLARALKERRPRVLEGEQLALLFDKPSLRTRASFQVGMHALGGNAFYLSPEEVGVGVRESIADVARALSRYVDIVAVRTYGQALIEEYAQWSGIPVINALTDDEHPCQALADLLTLIEKWGDLAGHSFAFIGDGNNVAASLVVAAATMGMDVRIASPQGYQLPEDVLIAAETRAAEHGGRFLATNDPVEAATGAEALYTDTWISMGQEREAERRRAVFVPYQLNAELVGHANPGAFIMHDLPAHRGEEITDDVFESEQSIIFDQAENRTWGQVAAIVWLLGYADRVER
jgi:ornithine carbamoyltransferase